MLDILRLRPARAALRLVATIGLRERIDIALSAEIVRSMEREEWNRARRELDRELDEILDGR